MNWHDIVGNELAKRALEVALVGAHSVLLVGPAGSGKARLIATVRSAALQYFDGNIDMPHMGTQPLCACGHTLEVKRIAPRCTCTLADKDAHTRRLREVADAVDIVVVTRRPTYDELCNGEPNGERIEAVLKRVSCARQHPEPSWTLPEAGHALLRQAYNTFALTPYKLARIRGVAASCARLAGEPLGVPHIAEAIMFTMLRQEELSWGI